MTKETFEGVVPIVVAVDVRKELFRTLSNGKLVKVPALRDSLIDESELEIVLEE
ncbi:hypothetical protein ABMS27_10765 [Lactiplantibacillus plantarum]|uniref:hypothetical protein n=1 Tax=Lactiplantibacillus plantarum TaxID=1590 RepID=UPI001B6BD575|nr:hypothetical protein [Lactiplantibacillus plantarum]MBP5842135.1 hypothetical protein [Lactiplantibacillus plantarum]UNB86153.1 hypothetical protein LXM95_07395 [Lactiplantibacillus plantarum]